MGDGLDDLFVYSPHAGMADAYRNMDYHFYNYSEVLQYYVPFEVRNQNRNYQNYLFIPSVFLLI